MGRAKSISKQKRSVMVRIRMTPDDVEQFRFVAGASGYTLSAWLRFLAKSAVEQRQQQRRASR